MYSKRILLAAIAATLAYGSWSFAGTLVDFKPGPVSPNIPEFVFSRALGGGIPVLRGGPGATGNADGNLLPNVQTPGGLDAEAPFLIPGIPGGNLNVATTMFHDTTLVFTGGLQADAAAIPAGPTFVQPLSPGSFDLLSTDPDGAGVLQPTLLLRGNITTASFIVGSGNSGAVFNASGINYTAGVIFNALVLAGGTVNNNSMSISMVDVAPPFAIAGDGFLADFNTNGTGLFNANTVPEPTSMALLTFAAAGLFCRRVRR